MSLADNCYLCKHELMGDICTEDYCKCECNGEEYKEY
jgi:hypothetical protein